jgi:hypothetical protein
VGTLAAHAAIALTNAELLEQTVKRAAQLEVLQAASARMSAATTIEEIGETIVDETARIIEYHNARVYVVEASDDVVPIAFKGRVGAYEQVDMHVLACKLGVGFTGWVAQHGEPLLVNDANADPRGETIVGTDDVDESMLVVPMRYDGTDRRQHVRVTGYTYPGPGAEPDVADEIIISPDSGSVLALIDNYVYMVTLPVIGGQTPTISISDPSSAAFPVKRLTMIGGEFVGWTNDGRQAYWSAGRSFLKWDPVLADSLDKIKQRTDSIRGDSLKTDAFKALADSVQKRLRSRSDSLAKQPAYEPQRVDVTIHVPRDVPKGTVVLRGARIISMKGDEVIENGDVVVTDNRLVSVGARGNAPAGAHVIDVSG